MSSAFQGELDAPVVGSPSPAAVVDADVADAIALSTAAVDADLAPVAPSGDVVAVVGDIERDAAFAHERARKAQDLRPRCDDSGLADDPLSRATPAQIEAAFEFERERALHHGSSGVAGSSRDGSPGVSGVSATSSIVSAGTSSVVGSVSARGGNIQITDAHVAAAYAHEDGLDEKAATQMMLAAATIAGASARASQAAIETRIKELKRASDEAKTAAKNSAKKRQRLADRLKGVSQTDLAFALSMMTAPKGDCIYHAAVTLPNRCHFGSRHVLVLGRSFV